jgi:hypothetical protein
MAIKSIGKKGKDIETMVLLLFMVIKNIGLKMGSS